MNSKTDIDITSLYKSSYSDIDKKLKRRPLIAFNILLMVLFTTNLVAQETNCVDGIDNDSDGNIDYLDDDCDSRIAAAFRIDSRSS